MKALILDNKVVDLSESEFPVAAAMSWMDAPESCAVGWIVEDGVLTKPPGPSEESLMNSLRTQRNFLLAETDYFALADATLTDEMRAYRQALRDLPATTTDAANPDWPVKPS